MSCRICQINQIKRNIRRVDNQTKKIMKALERLGKRKKLYRQKNRKRHAKRLQAKIDVRKKEFNTHLQKRNNFTKKLQHLYTTK